MLMTFVAFFLVFGPLVLLHELGHFLAARAFGVYVQEFSIGFGPTLLSVQRGETRFSFRALPLGGYVLMLGMNPDDEPEPTLVGRSLVDKKVWQRAVVSLAGPVANLLVAIPIFFLLGTVEAERLEPVVGQVFDDGPAAAAGFVPGDRVLTVDGQAVDTFEAVARTIRGRGGESITVVVQRGEETHTLTVVPDTVPQRSPLGVGRTPTGYLGLGHATWRPWVHVVTDSAAYAAGLRTFDLVVAVGGVPVGSWVELVDRLDGELATVELTVMRPQALAKSWAALDVLQLARITLPQGVAFAGVVPAQATVFHVAPGSPAAQAGIAVHDRFLQLDGRPVTDLAQVAWRIQSEPERAWPVTLDRNGQTVELSLQAVRQTALDEMRTEQEVAFLGVYALDRNQAFEPGPRRTASAWERFRRGAYEGFVRPFEIMALIAGSVVFMIFGQIDSSNLGGPMMIAQVAGQAAQAGWLSLLGFAALISLNLGVLNLAPVPGLDGGTLSLLAYEGITRRPLSARARQIVAYVGLASIVLLMLFVFKNDIQRYWPDLANWLNA